MNVSWNPNVLAARMSVQPVVQMGQDLQSVEMGRRKRRSCKFGRTKAGTCRKSRRR